MRKGIKVNNDKEVGSYEDYDQKGCRDPEPRITRKNSVTRDEVGQVNPSWALQSPESTRRASRWSLIKVLDPGLAVTRAAPWNDA